MTAPTLTCGACGQPWSVVDSTAKAHPGSDASGHWTADGPSAHLAVETIGTEVHQCWTCLCGRPLVATKAAVELVTCTYRGGESGMCSSARKRRTPPPDLYTNPAHGGRCECCGQQGSHWVRVDRQGPLPTCLQDES